MCLTLLLICTKSIAIEIAVGSYTLNSPSAGAPSYETVLLGQSYTAPLIFHMPVDSVPSESSVRIRQVLGGSFQIAHVFPDGSNSDFPRPDIDYLVIESGTHTLAGATIIADSIQTQAYQSKFDPASSWALIDYSAAGFSTAPVVLAQIQTNNNETSTEVLTSPSRPWMTAIVRNVGLNTAEIALDRAETTIGSVGSNETIAYLVIDAGIVGSFIDSMGTTIDFQSVRSNNNITNNCTTVSFSLPTSSPIGFATQNTRNGADGGWLRKCSISNASFSLKLQEDISTDPDVNHTTERAGTLAFTDSFLGAPGNIGFRMEANTASFTISGPATLSATTIPFGGSFASPPRVFLLPNDDVPEPVSLRVLNISNTNFTVAQVQPLGEPGAAAAMDIDYLAAIDGIHFLDDDTAIEVGVIQTGNTQFNSPATGNGLYSRINFLYDGFSTSPVTLTQIQTTNSETIDPSNPSAPWMTVAANQVSAVEFDVALERAEVNDAGIVSPEDIAYFAIDPNVQGTFLPGDGSTILFETLRPTNIGGVDNGCNSAAYNHIYPSTPLVIASQSTRNGNNGGWAKRCAISNLSIGLQIDEDRASDSERGHIAEAVDVLVWSAGFAGDFATPDLDVALGFDLATPTPGDLVNLTVTVTNNGNTSAKDPVLNAEVARFTGLVLDAFTGTPFEFLEGDSGLVDGAPAYSQDNGLDTYGYLPGTAGTDTTITNWRIPFSGSMPSGSSFTISYRVQVN